MQRVGEARVVEKLDVRVGDWKPQRNMCHHNVTYFCEHNPDWVPVRGWLYFDLQGLDISKFVSHSIVRDSAGAYWDITPLVASQDYPFVTSNLSEDEYADLVEIQGCSELCPKKRFMILKDRRSGLSHQYDLGDFHCLAGASFTSLVHTTSLSTAYKRQLCLA